MHVARLQAQHVDRRKMADGIALMAVQHHLGPRRRAGGEIEEQRIVGLGHALGRERARPVISILETVPAWRAAHGDPRIVAGELGEARGERGRHDRVADAAALEPVLEVRFGQERGRGNDDGAQFHQREHRLPQRTNVRQQQEHAVAARDAERAQVVRDLVRARLQFAEAQSLLGLADEPQRRAVPRQMVEMVERPVEAVELRPAELAHGRVVIRA